MKAYTQHTTRGHIPEEDTPHNEHRSVTEILNIIVRVLVNGREDKWHENGSKHSMNLTSY
jgi:hypothetical protein